MSNKSTKYEIYVKVEKAGAGTEVVVMVFQPNVMARAFASPSIAPLPCSSDSAANVVQILAGTTESAAGSGYYFNVWFNTVTGTDFVPPYLGSGLTDGAYPKKNNTPSSGDVIMTDATATSTNIKLTMGSTVAAATNVVVDFYITVGLGADGGAGDTIDPIVRFSLFE